MRSKPSSLYVHIPFCKNICSYCDFKKFIYNQKRVDDYFQSLFFELEKYTNRKYKTIYVGGGTPSCINKDNLEKLLLILSNMLSDSYKEFAIESNIEDIDENYLQLLKRYKINRLSIGVQSIVPKHILLCNRHHDENMARKNITLASKYFDNISIDMIYALPNQTKKELQQDLNFAVSLPIKHISYYSLLVEENTILYAKGYKNTDDKTQANMYKQIVSFLSFHKFSKYEVSNFSKTKKYQSFHNKTYWENEHYDAVGIAASGYIDNTRYTNTTNITKYINRDFSLSEKVELSKKDVLFDEIMLNLRLDKGISISKISKKFNIDFIKMYENVIKKYIRRKCLVIENGRLHTTIKGCLLLNSILVDFLE